MPPEKRPEVILILDNSSPIVITGIEECNIPIVFYAVDTQHHLKLHRYLSHVADKTIIAQKDYLPHFADSDVPVSWMPLWASQRVEPKPEKKHGAVFVGTLNPKLNPDRVEFFDALKQKVEMLCLSGAWQNIFTESEIVINQTVKRDLNFRVFEAMVSGALLVTERIENGLFDLFEDGEHLVTYEKGNVSEAASVIKKYLDDKALCRSIAAHGREEVLARHLESHRFPIIHDALTKVKKRCSPIKFAAAMANYSTLGRIMGPIDTTLSNRAFLSALRAGEGAVKRGEKIDDDLACFLVLAAIRYDVALKSDAGARLIDEAGEANPECALLALARMRALLNGGKKAEAVQVAKKLGVEDTYRAFEIAEQAVTQILAENSA